MAIKRQGNWLGQQRFDIPHFRALESAIAADIDLLAGNILAGSSPQVVRGFTVKNPTVIGIPAETLSIVVASGVITHPTASEAGTILSVPSTQADEVLNSLLNSKVSGSFQAGAMNYVGLDLTRAADDTTSDVVQFLSADTNQEIPRTVPLARTLDYKIYISTIDFDINSHLLPIAIITTDASNNVTVITDARPMLFRLGSGGNLPSATYSYPWTSRIEAAFSGADKDILSFKDWSSAVMSRLWEVGGGEQWYSPATLRDVKMVRTGLSPMSAFSFAAPTLTYGDIMLLFTNGTGDYNDITPGTATLNDGDCLYVDIDRTQNATLLPAVAARSTLGSGLPYERFVIAWREGANVYTSDAQWPVGTTWDVADIGFSGTVRLNLTPSTGVEGGAASSNLSPAVVAIDANGVAKNTARVGTTPGFQGTGFGAGNNSPGVYGLGSVAGSPGLRGTGTGSSPGVRGDGLETGVVGVGGPSGKIGGDFTGGDNAGGTPGGIGVQAAGGESPGVGGYGARFTGGRGDVTGGAGLFCSGGRGLDGGAGGEVTGGNAAVGGGGAGGVGIQGTGGSGDGAGADGVGVKGISTKNIGVYGQSTSGYGVYSFSTSNDGIYSTTGSITKFGVEAKGAGGAGGSAGGIAIKGVGGNGDGNGDGGHGIEGQGGGKAGSGTDGYGVYGHSSGNHGIVGLSNSTTKAGVYGYNNNANGTGVEGVTEDGDGGYFHADGDGNGVAGTAFGGGAGGSFVAVNDGDAIRAWPQGAGAALKIYGGEIVYDPAPTRYVTVTPTDFVQTLYASDQRLDLSEDPLESKRPLIGNSSTSDAAHGFARVYIPAGATITAVDGVFYSNFDALTPNVSLVVSLGTYSSGGPSANKYAMTNAVSGSEAISPGYTTKSFAPITALTVPSDGYVSCYITMPVTNLTGGPGGIPATVFLQGVRITYRQPLNVPAV